MKNTWLKILVAVSAIMIAGSAAYFSVTGLGILFSGAAVAVMVMAGSLEFAKLVTATYLKQEWDNIKGLNKWYLTSAVVILMAITSAGIFGYLSNAFQQQNLKLEQVQREIQVWQNKIDFSNQQILTLQTQSKDLTTTQSTLITKGNVNNRLLRSVDNRDKQSVTINRKINSLQDSIIVYNGKINDVKNANIGIEREVGGFRFVAEAFGVGLNSVVKYFIFLIVIVFDPLAVALVISFNQLVLEKRKEDEPEVKTEPNITPEPIPASDLMAEVSRLRLSEEDLKILEETLLNPPQPNENLKAAAEYYKSKVNENKEPFGEMLIKEDNDRMDIIGQNGNEGLHYEEDDFNDYGERINKNHVTFDLDDDNQEDVNDDEDNGITPANYISKEETQLVLKQIINWENEPKEEKTDDWDVTLMDGLEDEKPFYTEEEIEEILSKDEVIEKHYEPTEDEELQNFSTIEPNDENFFQEEKSFDVLVDVAIDNEPELTFEEKQVPDDVLKELNEVQTEIFSQEPTKLEEPTQPESEDEKKK